MPILNNSRYLPGACLILAISACQSLPEAEPPALTKQAEEIISEPVETVDMDRQKYAKGLTALREDKVLLGIELLQQVSIKRPELKSIFTNLGLAYFKQKSYDKAEQAFRQSIESNPDDAIAYNHLGIIKRLQGEFDSARENYQKAIQIDDNYANAHLNLGILYDIYLQNLKLALLQYKSYQAITNGENKTVGKWIADIQRQLKTANTGIQG